MDVMVVPDGDEPTSWSLRDRLSRAWGRIIRQPSGEFRISVDFDEGQSELRAGPHATLDLAMSEVARYTRGQVQLIGDKGAEGDVP